jgi:hypothetical protein
MPYLYPHAEFQNLSNENSHPDVIGSLLTKVDSGKSSYAIRNLSYSRELIYLIISK